MKPKTLARHVVQGCKNVGRNGWMTVAAITSVAVTLFILGGFVLLTFNINHFVDNMEGQVEISAFVNLEATEAELLEIEQDLQAIDQIQDYYLVPKDEGMNEFIETMGDDGLFLDDLRENNPLPDRFIIYPRDPQDVFDISEQVEASDHIYLVRNGGTTTEQLFVFTDWVRNIGLVIIVGLAFTAMLLIANTIKATIAARQREVEIMRLVGATNGFIRGPFFVEGFLLGLIGAVVPVALLLIGYRQLLYLFYESERVAIEIIDLLPMQSIALQLTLLLIAIGVCIGVWGSVMSVRKYLKI